MQKYRELTKLEIEELINSPNEKLEKINNPNKEYLKKTLDAHDFYVGRMLEEGNETAENILKSKYLSPNEKGPLHVWHRVANAISSVESTPEKQEESYYKFMDSLDDFKLIPGGRIMHGAGREDISTTLNNCYVVGIKKDSINAIYNTVKDEAMTYKKGGGCGHNLSILRPDKTGIDGTGGISCGPVGFMELYSVNTDTIAQHGRRGALMMNISDWHPDIEKFIQVKNDTKESVKALEQLLEKYPHESEAIEVLSEQIEKRRSVQHANVSVLLGHEFMKAVEEDKTYTLKFPDVESYSENKDVKNFYNKNWDGDLERWEKRFREAQEKEVIPKDFKIIKEHGEVRARDVWNKIIENAHESAEPGILFWDTMRDYHNIEYKSPLVSTNPCAEEPLPDGGCCNLASVNLERMVKNNGKLDWNLFETTIRNGTRFLDNVIDYNLDRHALEEQKINAIEDRRIGLGITGLGDMLLKMGIKYDTPEGLEKVDEVMKFFRDTSYDESINLAKEKGVFPNYDFEGLSKSKFIQKLPEEIRNKIKKNGLRNGTLTTCAPVGSGAMIAEGSSGIEPIFAVSYERDVKTHEDNEIRTFTVYHPLVEKLFPEKENIPKEAVSSHEIDPFFRVKMQGTIQKYIDASISSTINLPRDVSKETVADIYLAAYKEGLKGVTVYREDSRKGVMRTTSLEEKIKDVFPEEYYKELLMKKLDRKRPKYVGGIKEKIQTPHGYNAFVGINWEKGEKGELIVPYEAFVEIGKAGDDLAAIAQGFGRLTSLLLKAGIPHERIADQLIGIGGDSQVGYGESKVKSLPDAIGQGMESSAKKEEEIYRKIVGEEEKEEKPVRKRKSGNLCSRCGRTLIMQGGCEECPVHGSEKC